MKQSKLQIIKQWFIKFISGFAIWKGAQFGKIIFFSVIVVSWIFIFYQAVMKPTSTQIQRQDQQTSTHITNSQIDELEIYTGQSQKQEASWMIPSVEIERSTQGKETVFRLKWTK